METLRQDVRYAVRQLSHRRGATLVLVLTLGLGVGANTAMLALLNALLFRPAPVPEPSQLVWIAKTGARGSHPTGMSYPDFADIRERAASFSGVAAWSRDWLSIGGVTPQRVAGLVVSGNYFDVLKTPAAVGRTFRADEDGAPGAHPVVVLSDGFWRSRFGADPRVVDSPIVVNGHPFTVIGVAPPGFEGVEVSDDAPVSLFLPLAMLGVANPDAGTWTAHRDASWLRVMARLKPNVTHAQSGAELAGFARAFHPPSAVSGNDRAWEFAALPVLGGMDPANRTDIAPLAPLLLAVPLLLLVVACANAANVLLARALERRKELAMRRALGATRARLVRQLLTESVLLGLLAAVAGVVLSFWLTALIARTGDVPDAIVALVRPDWRVLMVTTVLAVTAGVLFGLAPALAATRPSLAPALKEEGATPGMAGRPHRLRDALVVGQVAVSLVLLITASLFLKSLSRMLNADPGFAARHGVVVSYDLALQGYDHGRRTAFERDLLAGVLARSGIAGAALSSAVPFGGRFDGTDVQAESSDGSEMTFRSSVSPSYFATMQAHILRGRDFSASDDPSSSPVVIVNETLARRLWPTSDAIGQRLHFAERGEPLREVVGVVRDGKYANLTEATRPYLFLPHRQRPTNPMVLVVRSELEPAVLVALVTGVARTLDPDIPLFRITSLAQLIRNGADKQRSAASMLGVFGGLALFLAALGLYSVAAHAVTLRTREIGIRMSLGARAADVRQLFVREGLVRAGVGIAIGLALSAALSTLLSGLLVGLAASDALSFVVGGATLTMVAVAASYIPARRAARVDPMIALRTE